MASILAVMWLLQGCAAHTPQKIYYCAEYNLYTNKIKLDAAYRAKKGSKDSIEGFYETKDNSIHVMKWDFETLGHEVYHGLKGNGLIIENGFEHWR